MKQKKNTAPVAVKETYTIEITGLGSSGEGVGKYENFTVFVPYALPGERVDVTIDLVKKNYAKGHIEKILESSPYRIEPVCPVYDSCGGCQLQHVNYEEQLRLKTQMVRDVVERIGKMDPALVLDTIGPKEPWHYRNKMQMPVGGKGEHLRMGFYSAGSHDIVHCTDCAIQQEGNNQIARAVYDIAKELGITSYDEKTGQGSLRHVIGRIGRDEWMVILVTAIEKLEKAELWVKALRERLPQVSSIIHNYNPQRTNVIMGHKSTVLWGQERINDFIEELSFKLSSHSFFQVNPEQTEVLYGKALGFAALEGGETVIDAYCGTGTISLFLAHKAKKVIGIEIVEPAITDAKENAKRNGFDNTEFIAADAAVEMPKLYKKGIKPDVIVFDPIRAGCKEEVLQAAASMKPKKIVYVSCNPASMARDMAILNELGYETVKIQPVDMFPQTAHVETVALLCRKDIDSHIEVKLELDEDDVTKAESKGTYENIKEYVLDKYGFKVSTLYIAQIKRKCGLELGENYNKSKKENSKVPECPKEKEEAIMDALKHFKMIVQEEWYTKSIQTCLTV